MMQADDHGLSQESAPAAAAASASSAAGSASASASASAASPDPSTLPLNHFMSMTCLPPLRERLELFTLYETKSKLYLVGSPLSGAYYRILKIDRLSPDYSRLLSASSTAFCDDGLSYDAIELGELLRMIDQGNSAVGGLKELCKNAVGVVGFIRFLQGYYLILATSRRLVGRLGGHRIYEVTSTEMFPITHSSVYSTDKASSASGLMDKLRGSKESKAQEKLTKTREAESAAAAGADHGPALHLNSSKIKTNESKYKSLFQGLDLNKCFYFSPTGYELTQTLQANMMHAGKEKQKKRGKKETEPAVDPSHNPAQAAAAASAAAPPPPPVKSMYLWNHFLLSKFYRLMSAQRREQEMESGEAKSAAPLDDDDEPTEGRDDEMGPESEHACDAAIPHTATGVALCRSSPASRSSYLNPASSWAIPLIHGYFTQTHVSIFGSLLDLTLLARRSRFFAGTRYLKRGLNHGGRVANDVEVEQIVWSRHAAGGVTSPLEGSYTSYVQVRGSIPLYWSQEGNPLVAQPAIVVRRTDPLHLATRLHVEDLMSRYGSPLLILNLVKQTEKKRREGIIGEGFREAVEFINKFIQEEEHKIDFLSWDFKRVSQSKTHSVVDELGVISQWSLQRTGTFHSRPHFMAFPTSARGTIQVKPTRESIRMRIRGEENAEAGVGAGAGTTAVLARDQAASRLRQSHFYHLASHCAAHAARSSGRTTTAALVTSALTGPVSRFRRPLYPLPSFPVHHLGFLQRGVVRTNCIDSLDRTNVAQFCLGKCALGYQLFALGVTDSIHLSGEGAASGGLGGTAGGDSSVSHGNHGGVSSAATSSSEIVTLLLDLYEGMGDELSQQYGGSAMHRSIRSDTSKDGKNTLTLTQSKSKTDTKEVLVSIRRHIQNSFQDNGKQDAINLFLGYFTPPDLATMAASADTPKPVQAASMGTYFPFTALDPPSTPSSSSSPVPPSVVPVHPWDMTSDWFLHNPTPITVVNKMQYNGGGGKIKTRERGRRGQKTETEGPNKQLSSLPPLRGHPSSSLFPSASRHSLELGHVLYPDPGWYRNPIREFESKMKGYLQEWLMSFPETEEEDDEETETDSQPKPEMEIKSEIETKHPSELNMDPMLPVSTAAADHSHPPLYYSNAHGLPGTLSSFDDLLSPDIYKNHSIRILAEGLQGAQGPVAVSSRGTITAPSPHARDASASSPSHARGAAASYSSLIPRFLWRRQKAEDEEDDEGDEESASAPPVSGGAATSGNTAIVGLDGVATNSLLLDYDSPPPRFSTTMRAVSPPLVSKDDLNLPASWLDPSQRGSVAHEGAATFFGRFDDDASSSSGGTRLDELTAAQRLPGAHTLSDTGAQQAHFSATGPAPHLSSPRAAALLHTAALYLEYLHAPHLSHLVHAPLVHKSMLLDKHGVGTPTDWVGIGGAMAEATGSQIFVTTAQYRTPTDRKMKHYLEHYAQIRVEHNLIVEPLAMSEAQARIQRDLIGAAANAVGAALRYNFSRQSLKPPPVPSKVKKRPPPSHTPPPPGGAATATTAGTTSPIAAFPSHSPTASMSDEPPHLSVQVSSPTPVPHEESNAHCTSAAAAVSAPAPSSPAFERGSSDALTAQVLGVTSPTAGLTSPASGSGASIAGASTSGTLGPPPTPMATPPIFAPAASTASEGKPAAVSALAPSNDRRLSNPATNASGNATLLPLHAALALANAANAAAGAGSPPSASSSASLSLLPPPLPARRSPSVCGGALFHDGFGASGFGAGPIPLFSHAPPNSSITIRNTKKAAFYSAYLRRGEWDAEFLASSFEIARITPGNAAIVIEVEEDKRNREMYEQYVNPAS